MTLYAVGDLQGCLGPFESLLERIAFDPGRDRLWLAGDLVNRGPQSLGTLRRIVALGDCVTTVLGNHDLHLLAAAAGARRPRPADTFDDVLGAPDVEELLDWLRRRPLLHYERAAARALVHAGIPPAWSASEAETAAREVESVLRGPHWREVLAAMYGNEPREWMPSLPRDERLRYTVNALTRMRFCDRRGRLDLEHSGPPGTQPAGLVPWFDVPERAAADVQVVCGHWSALGVLRRADLIALDSGCVWGRALTAVPLDPPGDPIAVECAAARVSR